MRKRVPWSVLFLAILSIQAFAQTPAPEAAHWVADLASRYNVTPNVTYLLADDYEAKLDVYVPRSASAAAPAPTVVFFHGGGWTGGDKNVVVLRLLPYLEMGWAAVNVNYRLALALAAVEDCRCALRWVIRNAAKNHFDAGRLVVTGESAGSHLALVSAIAPGSAGLDQGCPGAEALKVAAVVNWYGVTDVLDVLEGAHQQPYAVRWLGSRPDAEEVARRVSPLQYVRAALPPILTFTAMPMRSRHTITLFVCTGHSTRPEFPIIC